jgi:glycerophosphoryl diester phosphodiesterase
VRCFAHRGFAGVNPENTVSAVERAVQAGATGVEVDVRRCGSGELVVVHDETVDRVSDASGRVSDLSLPTLQSLDVLDTGRGVPTLAAVVDIVPPDCVLNVELKETGLAADMVETVGEWDVLVSSFEREALEEVSAVSNLPLAFLCRDLSGGIDVATSLGCEAIHPNHHSCTEDAVARAQDAGLSVNAWTVRSAASADRLVDVGVDGLIADSPAYCRT